MAEKRFVLVEKGRAVARIVVADESPAAPVAFAAQELQRYVREMSGASLPIAAGAGPAIVLSADPAAAARLGAGQPPAGSEEGYLLQAAGDRLCLVGAGPRAVLYAAYDLLERLGCGWCVPGDDTVPLRSTLAVGPLRVSTTPAFPYRMMLDFPMRSVGQSLAIIDWLAKNRMSWVHPCENAHGEPKVWYARRDRVVPELRKRGLHLIFGGHTMHTWLPEENYKDHPEWFAVNDGERRPPTVCVTNAVMTEELVRNLRRFLDRCPEVEVVDLWHPDGATFCHCPACTRGLVPEGARGKPPEGMPADAIHSAYVISYIEFMNRVGAAIAQSHPRVMVSPLIYGTTDRAMPDGCPAPADNLLVGLAHIYRDSYRPLAGEPKSAMNTRFLGNDLTWMARSRHHFIYEYYNCHNPPFIYPGAQVIVQDLRLLKRLGAQGSSSDMLGYSPANTYVAARALWSPSISWEEAVRGFHRRYYGDVGKEMAENWVSLEKGIYGKPGHQANGAAEVTMPWLDLTCGKWLLAQRPAQIALLVGLLGRTKDPLVRARIQRALRPWKEWGEDARWWAFPPFAEPGERISR